MITLREIYDIKKKLIEMNIDDLIDMINSNGINASPSINNTIRIESEDGLDTVTNTMDSTIPRWYGLDDMQPPIHLFYNILPLSNNTCILKI